MKKPNITKGKWKLIPPEDDFGLCLVNTKDELTIHDGFDISNAKAISAVPEMIDALIETRTQLTIAMSHEEPIPTKVLVEWCTQVEQALIKAGCTE
jgi:hypothetical protein